MKLNIQQLSKSYGKGEFAIKDISLNLEPGVLGLLGPNGAGKSTLLKIISTANQPTLGRMYFNNVDILKYPNEIRSHLGFLPQDFGVYPNLNAYEFLTYMAALKGISGNGLHHRINALLDGLNLTSAAKKSIGNYSGGMRQRIGIAQALLNNPKVLLLDEPTVGLDPEERVRFRNLISELAQETIVILSSHIVSDIDTIADRVAIMHSGNLLVVDDIPSIIKPIKNKVYEIALSKDAIQQFKQQQFIVSTQRHQGGILVRFIADQHITGAKLQPANLEDAFLFFTKSSNHA